MRKDLLCPKDPENFALTWLQRALNLILFALSRLKIFDEQVICCFYCFAFVADASFGR